MITLRPHVGWCNIYRARKFHVILGTGQVETIKICKSIFLFLPYYLLICRPGSDFDNVHAKAYVQQYIGHIIICLHITSFG